MSRGKTWSSDRGRCQSSHTTVILQFYFQVGPRKHQQRPQLVTFRHIDITAWMLWLWFSYSLGISVIYIQHLSQYFEHFANIICISREHTRTCDTFLGNSVPPSIVGSEGGVFYRDGTDLRVCSRTLQWGEWIMSHYHSEAWFLLSIRQSASLLVWAVILNNVCTQSHSQRLWSF